jgi:hypothetical protein
MPTIHSSRTSLIVAVHHVHNLLRAVVLQCAAVVLIEQSHANHSFQLYI